MNIDLLIKICEMLIMDVEEIIDIKYESFNLPIKFTILINNGKSYNVEIYENKFIYSFSNFNKQ